ncbi:MAG TPA: hypothetical protein VIQ60_14470 [Gemmatimonadaceae bacterium]
MNTRSTAAGPRPTRRWAMWGGVLLLGVGLLGHLYAAYAIGGSRVAYTHHVLGFFLILLVTGGLIAGVGWRFWRSRPALAVLAIGAVQAIVGMLIAAEPFRAAAGT